MRILKKCLKGARVVLTWLVSSLFPIDNKKIVLSSYYGRGYGDNPKYIAEELIKLGKDLKIIWLVKDEKDAVTLPAGICGVKTYSTKGIFHLCTAKVWVDVMNIITLGFATSVAEGIVLIYRIIVVIKNKDKLRNGIR